MHLYLLFIKANKADTTVNNSFERTGSKGITRQEENDIKVSLRHNKTPMLRHKRKSEGLDNPMASKSYMIHHR